MNIALYTYTHSFKETEQKEKRMQLGTHCLIDSKTLKLTHKKTINKT